MPQKFKLHSEKQSNAYFSEKPIVLLASGIQFGKSLTGALKLLRLVHRYNSPNANFLVLAPTYKVLYQSTLKTFKQVFGNMGVMKESKGEYVIPGGSTIFFRSGQNPDSIVGITNIFGIWADESGLYTLYFWENIQARASFKQAQIILTTSPYSLNWVYKEIIRPFKKGLRDDVCLIQATSKENPYFPAEEYDRKQQTMDPRRFRMIYGGEFERPDGLVYDCFDEDKHIIDPIPLASDTRYVAGVDWGYNDPFVIIVRAITRQGKHFEVAEYYKTQLTITPMLEIAKKLQSIYNIERFYCDPSRPDYIAEFNRHKLTAVGAENDIRTGIDRHYELIKSGDYGVFKSATPHLIDEYSSYHYPEPKDLKPDQSSSIKMELPVDQTNHCADVVRYLTAMTYKSGIKHTPIAPDELQRKKISTNPQQHIKNLIKKPLIENWS